MPNYNVKAIELGISYLDKVVRWDGFTKGPDVLRPLPYAYQDPGVWTNTVYVSYTNNKWYINVRTWADRTDETGWITIYYTKTT